MIDFCRVVVRLLLYIHIFLFVSFAISQIVRMFVVFNNVIGKRKPAICVGIFYVIIYYFVVGILKDIRLLPPCGTLMRPQPMTVLNDGKGQPFFLSIMPNCSIVMAELVIKNSNGSDVTTSLIVAQVFGKNHKDVLRDIEKLSCSEDFRMRNFAHTPLHSPTERSSLPLLRNDQRRFQLPCHGLHRRKSRRVQRKIHFRVQQTGNDA